jgi:hypothetical protein
VDPRNEAAHGPGWTEWELVRRAEPRWPGHRQPRMPLWGYEDEANPAVMARKIAGAADHGVDAWLFDWYWYDDGPYLQRALEEGFLRAPNRGRIKFALMWANHTWVNIHPAKLGCEPPAQFGGEVTPATFEALTDHIVARYFAQPNYWCVDGCPYFSIYELDKFVNGLGGLAVARAALERFRAKTRAAGFPDLHLNIVLWSVRLLPGETSVADPQALLRLLGFDSISSYVWVHHVTLERFPEMPYTLAAERAEAHWRRTVAEYDLPFYPNVTMGWDASPRTVQSDAYLNTGYPFMPTLSGNTPEAFQRALESARAFLDTRPPGQRILSLNAWNEWTEGSYLEPDRVHGLAYLEAVRRVFGT